MKKLFIPALFAIMLAACSNGGGNSPTPGPKKGRLDIDEATARKNLDDLAASQSFLASFKVTSIETGTYIHKFGAKKDYFYKYLESENDHLVSMDRIGVLTVNESENTVYRDYDKNQETGVYEFHTEVSTVEAPRYFDEAKKLGNSYLVLAHVLDANEEYVKSSEEATIAGRTAVIYDRDTETSHERYWVDKTLGITLKNCEYASAERAQATLTVMEVTSFVTGAESNLPEIPA